MGSVKRDLLKGFATRQLFNGDIDQIVHVEAAIKALESLKDKANSGGCVILRYEKRRTNTPKGYTHLEPFLSSTPRAHTPMQLDAHNVIIKQDSGDELLYQ